MGKILEPKTTLALVVDDMSLGRLSGKNLLKECGFVDIKMASSGVEAWKILEEEDKANRPIQLILCDWIMPDMSGIELVKKLKTRTWKVTPFIILVTAETDMELVKQARSEGAAGYVRKPLTLQTLQAALEKLGK